MFENSLKFQEIKFNWKFHRKSRIPQKIPTSSPCPRAKKFPPLSPVKSLLLKISPYCRTTKGRKPQITGKQIPHYCETRLFCLHPWIFDWKVKLIWENLELSGNDESRWVIYCGKWLLGGIGIGSTSSWETWSARFWDIEGNLSGSFLLGFSEVSGQFLADPLGWHS